MPEPEGRDTFLVADNLKFPSDQRRLGLSLDDAMMMMLVITLLERFVAWSKCAHRQLPNGHVFIKQLSYTRKHTMTRKISSNAWPPPHTNFWFLC